MLKFVRVVLGIAILLGCVTLFSHMTGFPFAALPNHITIILQLIMIVSMLYVSNGYGVLFRSIRFLLSDKHTLSEKEFEASAVLLKLISQIIILSSVVFALMHTHVGLGASDTEMILHALSASILDLLLGVVLVLLIINPLRATLAAKFYLSETPKNS